MIKIIHFADAHIDLARQGRHDPQTGLPLRVLDFLNAFDTIINRAIVEKVDLVIFAGDAYRDRSPTPTYQREWGKRIMRLSEAGVQTLLVIGNHDISPASGRAHTLQEFDTLRIPYIHVISRPCLLGPEELNGLQVQVIGIPWLNRSDLAAMRKDEEDKSRDSAQKLNDVLSEKIKGLMTQLDPKLPAILTSHATVPGAKYGNERSVMLGRDFVLPGDLLRDACLDYVALGHIHKFQNLNPEGHPPIIYPGSIERMDIGEINDRKTFILAELERGNCAFEPVDLPGRRFVDTAVSITDPAKVQEQILEKIPAEEEIRDAIFRLVIHYPRDLEAMIDEPAIRRKAESAFEFHLVRRPHMQSRSWLPEGKNAAAMTAAELLEEYWKTVDKKQSAAAQLNRLAEDIIQSVNNNGAPADDGQDRLL